MASLTEVTAAKGRCLFECANSLSLHAVAAVGLGGWARNVKVIFRDIRPSAPLQGRLPEREPIRERDVKRPTPTASQINRPLDAKRSGHDPPRTPRTLIGRRQHRAAAIAPVMASCEQSFGVSLNPAYSGIACERVDGCWLEYSGYGRCDKTKSAGDQE